MADEKKEQTAFEKLQAEYQNLCTVHGHLTSQIDTLTVQLEDNREALKKVVKRSANINKEAQKAANEAANKVAEGVPNVASA